MSTEREKAAKQLESLLAAEEHLKQAKESLMAADEYAWLIAATEKLQLDVHFKVKRARLTLEAMNTPPEKPENQK